MRSRSLARPFHLIVKASGSPPLGKGQADALDTILGRFKGKRRFFGRGAAEPLGRFSAVPAGRRSRGLLRGQPQAAGKLPRHRVCWIDEP